MPQPSFLPTGDQFYATIRRPGLEEVLQDAAGVSLKFPSAAAATLFAKNEIKRQETAAKPVPPVDPSVKILSEWKRQKADELRIEREAFEMRTIEVVTKKRRVRK